MPSADSQVTTLLSIQGMTCQSCVQTIEGAISQVTGVTIVSVDLPSNTGRVVHNPWEVTANHLSDKVDDMGFECRVISTGDSTAIPIEEGNKGPYFIASNGERIDTVVDIEGNGAVSPSTSGVSEGGSSSGDYEEEFDCSCGDSLVEIDVQGRYLFPTMFLNCMMCFTMQNNQNYF